MFQNNHRRFLSRKLSIQSVLSISYHSPLPETPLVPNLPSSSEQSSLFTGFCPRCIPPNLQLQCQICQGQQILNCESPFFKFVKAIYQFKISSAPPSDCPLPKAKSSKDPLKNIINFAETDMSLSCAPSRPKNKIACPPLKKAATYIPKLSMTPTVPLNQAEQTISQAKTINSQKLIGLRKSLPGPSLIVHETDFQEEFSAMEKITFQGTAQQTDPILQLPTRKTLRQTGSIDYQQPCKEQRLSIHDGIQCDGCKCYPIIGSRYKCLQCEDYDLCSQCHVHNQHSHEMALISQKKIEKQKQILEMKCIKPKNGCGQARQRMGRNCFAIQQ